PGVPRARQGRQRFRHRSHRQGSVSALGDRADDEKDAADVAVPRTARPVLRRQSALAERGVTTINAELAELAEKILLCGFCGFCVYRTDTSAVAANAGGLRCLVACS